MCNTTKQGDMDHVQRPRESSHDSDTITIPPSAAPRRHDDSTDEREHGAGSSKSLGHRFQSMILRDKARTHQGDVYGGQHNHYYGGHADEAAEAPEHVLLKRFLAALSFPQMGLRSVSVASAYSKTCQWLFETPQFKKWRDPELRSKHHGFLWIKGKPGSGKSTIMKCALKRARSERDSDILILDFFFTARGTMLERSTEGMYRSLLHQVAKYDDMLKHSVAPETFDQYQNHGWPVEELKDLFKEAVGRLLDRGSIVCYIDALDEGKNEDDVRDMIEFLQELAMEVSSDSSEFSVCFASRHYPKISIDRCEELVLDSQEGHGEDIASYVHSKLRVENFQLKANLASHIKDKCAGVFFWVKLVVAILNKEKDRGNRHDLESHLLSIPCGMRNLLEDIMKRDGSDERLLPAMQWILFAKQPLEPAELYFAITVSINKTSVATTAWNQGLCKSWVLSDFILSSTIGLTEIIDSFTSRKSVRFIHESVREYFLDSGLRQFDPDRDESVEAICHSRLAQWCHAYLKFASKTNPDAKAREMPFLHYALEGVLYHAEAAARCGMCFDLCMDQVFEFWRYRKLKWLSLRHSPEATAQKAQYEALSTVLQFFVYEGLEHLVHSELRRLGKLTLPERQLRLSQPCREAQHQCGRLGTALHIAALKTHFAVVDALIENGADVNTNCNFVGTALHVAVDVGAVGLVQHLVGIGADVNAQCEHIGTPMHIAVRNDNHDMSSALLASGADVTVACEGLGTAMFMAASKGDMVLVGMMLDHGWKLASCSDDFGELPPCFRALQATAEADVECKGQSTTLIQQALHSV